MAKLDPGYLLSSEIKPHNWESIWWVCWASLHAERSGGETFQFQKLKVIFSNIVSILINYPERLSKLLFEYFMAFHVNISRTKCYTLLFNNASSVRIYLWNLCSLLQNKGGGQTWCSVNYQEIPESNVIYPITKGIFINIIFKLEMKQNQWCNKLNVFSRNILNKIDSLMKFFNFF